MGFGVFGIKRATAKMFWKRDTLIGEFLNRFSPKNEKRDACRRRVLIFSARSRRKAIVFHSNGSVRTYNTRFACAEVSL